MISCLCVTHKKPDMLKRVIDCFNNQTYPDKEMIIIYEDNDLPTVNFLETLPSQGNIRLFKIAVYPEKKTLGELRNLSIQYASGEYVCQWDDDDWYTPTRLETQFRKLKESGKPASLLSRWIVYNTLTKEAYLSNVRLWEGSILCKREILLQYPYPSLSKGEDSSVIEVLNKNNHLALLSDIPFIYIYNYHGENTWEYDHFKLIFQFSTPLPLHITEEITELLNTSWHEE